MSDLARFWMLTVILAVGTWAMRSLPIMLHGKVAHPVWVERLLKHVPVAALTALVLPGVLYLHEGSAYSFSPSRLIAAAAAMVVALKTKNILATLVVGMSVLWLVQAALVAAGVA